MNFIAVLLPKMKIMVAPYLNCFKYSTLVAIINDHQGFHINCTNISNRLDKSQTKHQARGINASTQETIVITRQQIRYKQIQVGC